MRDQESPRSRIEEGAGKARQSFRAGLADSGCGFALLQLLVEEVTHDRFAHVMQQTVVDPLGMTGSTFELHTAMVRGVVISCTPCLTQATHYQFAAPGAASLYSNLTDLTRFVMAHWPGDDGAPPGRGVLPPG
jgi:CubicO group peptidase (beta-lactamase class C family)